MTDYSLDDSNRRDFMKAVVAVGGMSALSACLERIGGRNFPEGTTDPKSLPRGQHEWGSSLAHDDHGNTINARHHILRFLSLPDDYQRTHDDIETVETALQTIERAYEWSNDGVLFTLGYSPSYFDRYDSALNNVDLPAPEPLADIEDPEFDDYDAVLHLASDHADAVVEAEEALLGEKATANGFDVEAELTEVFTAPPSYPARRTGFVGEGLPAKFAKELPNVPDDVIPEDPPLFMGFKSGFTKNQASEDRVTINEGVFAGGTTQHISALELNLNQWWTQDDRWQRVAKMFSPTHADEGLVEGVGENLGSDSAMDESMALEKAAELFGVVGHSQKMLRAREDDEPVILRRDFDTTDGGDAGLHFVAVQETISDFVETREAMNGADIAADSPVGQRNNNGILQYLRTHRRGNYLLPPRGKRALPTPNGD